MKIGDKFKHMGSVFQLVSLGAYSKEVSILSFNSNAVLTTFSCRVKSTVDITKEEFQTLNQMDDLSLFKNMDDQPLFPDPEYSYGDDFIVVSARFSDLIGATYKLCQVESGRVALISLNSGNRYSDPIDVKNPAAVTEQELDRVLGKNYSELKIQKIV